MNWQPIDTAPKDGTRVLLRIEYSDVPLIAYFKDYGHGGQWHAETEHYTVSCGAYCYGGSVSDDGRISPTHWASLPGEPHDP